MTTKYFSLLLAFVVAVSLLACGPTAKNTISGNIANGGDLSIYLDQIQPNGATMVLENISTKANGDYAFKFENGLEDGIYRLRIGTKEIAFVQSANTPSIVINSDLDKLQTLEYEIQGSPSSTAYQSTIKNVIGKTIQIQDLRSQIEKTEDPYLASLLAIKTLSTNAPTYLSTHEKVLAKLQSAYPEAQHTKKYISVIQLMKNQLASQKKQSKFQIGDEAPEIALPNLDGKVMKLSDLKGQIVLIDFWASWCGPCRKANPHVVEVYKKYKSDGFTVFSVSLDGLDTRTKRRYQSQDQIDNAMELSKKKWLAAIEKDKLEWDYHVSDLKKWESEAARLYGVSSIPQTFLIGRDGNIAAVNPRFTLEEELEKIL